MKRKVFIRSSAFDLALGEQLYTGVTLKWGRKDELLWSIWLSGEKCVCQVASNCHSWFRGRLKPGSGQRLGMQRSVRAHSNQNSFHSRKSGLSGRRPCAHGLLELQTRTGNVRMNGFMMWPSAQCCSADSGEGICHKPSGINCSQWDHYTIRQLSLSEITFRQSNTCTGNISPAIAMQFFVYVAEAMDITSYVFCAWEPDAIRCRPTVLLWYSMSACARALFCFWEQTKIRTSFAKEWDHVKFQKVNCERTDPEIGSGGRGIQTQTSDFHHVAGDRLLTQILPFSFLWHDFEKKSWVGGHRSLEVTR